MYIVTDDVEYVAMVTLRRTESTADNLTATEKIILCNDTQSTNESESTQKSN